MEKKKQEDFLLKHKNKFVIAIISLLLLTGLLLVVINAKNDIPTIIIDTRANLYSGDQYESTEEADHDYAYWSTNKNRNEHDYDEDYNSHRDSDLEEDYYDNEYRTYYKDLDSENDLSGVYYYNKYIPYMREYEKIECYKTIPEDKLFYKMCPGF